MDQHPGTVRADDLVDHVVDELVRAARWRLTIEDATTSVPEVISCSGYRWLRSPLPSAGAFEVALGSGLPAELGAALGGDLADDLARMLADALEGQEGDDGARWELLVDEDLYLGGIDVFDLGLGSAPIGHRELLAATGGRAVRWHRGSVLDRPRPGWAATVRHLLAPAGEPLVVHERGPQVHVLVPELGHLLVVDATGDGVQLIEVRHLDGRLLNRVERPDSDPGCPVDLAALDALDADEAVELVRARYPRVRRRTHRRGRGTAHLHLLAPDDPHDPDDGWSLTSSDLLDRSAALDALALDDAVRAVLQQHAAELGARIELDSEGGLFCARADDAEPLRVLAALVSEHLVAGAELG